MGAYEITGQFSETAEKLTTDTSGHADNFNKLYEMLFNNDIFLKVYIEDFRDILESKADGNNMSFEIEGRTLVITATGEQDTKKVCRVETSNSISGVLPAREAELTLLDECIKTDSTIDIYTDCYGVNPKTVIAGDGSITMTFKPQIGDVNVKVVVK